MPIGTIRVELIFSHPTGKASGSGIVPPEVLKTLEAERTHYGIVTKWLYEIDPTTGQRLPAFTPIEGDRLALIESRGIGHCDEWHSEIYKLLLKLGIDRCRPPWVKVKDW